IGILLFALARRDGLPSRTCWVLAATPALCGNFLWLGLIGMEHLLFVMLSLASIYFWFETSLSHVRSAVVAGFAIGLVAITRPEAIVFGPLLVSFSLLKIRRSIADVVIAMGIWSAFVGILLGTNLYTSNSLLPATLKGRSWLYFHTSGGPHTVHSITRFLGAWIQRLPRQFSCHFVQQISSVNQIDNLFAAAGFAIAAIALIGCYPLISQTSLRIRFLILWASVHFCIYLVAFPTGGHGGRYQPMTLLLLFPALFLGVSRIFELVFVGHQRWATNATVSVLIVAGAAALKTWRTVAIDGIGHINSTHGMAALWLKSHVSPTAKIAAFDIGRISYDWARGITDLGGLVDPSYIPYLVHGQVPEYLEAKRIRYLVLPSQGIEDFGFANIDVFNMKRVAEYCSPSEPWLLGYRYTINATQCQEIYLLDSQLGARKSNASDIPLTIGRSEKQSVKK
ncbi:MAG: hypothetical protein QOJ42_4358, partial [Acidobacteriaceae bacterium]|nr:hypothetical protein [Acidobacteriaceae bacterium]